MSKLPILMYHHVSESESEGLTISVEKLEAQFAYLTENGFLTYHFSELTSRSALTSKKNVVLTFDDGYVSHLKYVQPLLKKYNLKATFFVPLHYLGKTDKWKATKGSGEQIMDLEQLKSLNSEFIELGFHSFYHKKYDVLSNEEIIEDTQKCLHFVEENALNFSPALAYPYGKFPREALAKMHFFQQLKDANFTFGLRIGNGVNQFPFKNKFEIERIDVKGEFSLSKFKRRLRFGKLF